MGKVNLITKAARRAELRPKRGILGNTLEFSVEPFPEMQNHENKCVAYTERFISDLERGYP